jgi:hypothetical protein
MRAPGGAGWCRKAACLVHGTRVTLEKIDKISAPERNLQAGRDTEKIFTEFLFIISC